MTNEEITDLVAASIAAIVERPDVTHANVAVIAGALAWGATELFNAFGGLKYAADEMQKVADGLAAQAGEKRT